MTSLCLSRTAGFTNNVTETIMNPLSIFRRPARWLMAAGLAVAFMPFAPAHAQEGEWQVIPRIDLGEHVGPRPESEDVEFFFEKTGKQINCDYVEYRLRFGLRGPEDILGNPALADNLKGIRFDFRDVLPAGLKIETINATGDGTDAVGGALPAAAISTTTNPEDTGTIADFRISAADLDGGLGERVIEVKITARIDQAAFPAPVLVDNQGVLTVTHPGGASLDFFSQDPAQPDDGDPRTGVKTSVLIDVTGCEPPPPPPPPGGGEPCFEVVDGEVDCVPGGGAFVYHMTVGADLAGNHVAVNSTTPGITVAEGPQLVPAGGGVLSWTIVGALPGDVVHLVVVGIESYAGPEEGVGLCCTQTVDIVIPEDLDCPDREPDPDLKVEKKAAVESCTDDGGCDFVITVTNVGPGPYNGPIVLDEVVGPAPGSIIDSGPNAPWTCLPAVSPMSCSHPATTLNPGEFVDLKIGFKPGPMWPVDYLGNCAEYDYAASGKPLFGRQDNDRDCARIPLCRRDDPRCQPPEEKKVDLTIRKRSLDGTCTLGGTCLWIIDVINSGTETINGPLTIVDTYPTGAPISSTFAPSPPWSCGPDGPAQFRCDHPGVVLVPGASMPIFVTTTIPIPGYGESITNCAEIVPVPDESDLTNNKACADARIPHDNPGQPALRITKTCDASVAGGAVHCRITVVSLGTSAPSGPVRVNDAATLLGSGTPVQIQTVTPDGAEWSCSAVPADTLSCQIPGAVMTPGTSRHFDVTVMVSPNERFENCARGSFGPAPGDDIVYPFGRACDQGGTDIHVEKTGDLLCEPGRPCTFEITIRNDGDSAFSGTVRIGDGMEVEGFGRLEGVAIAEISPPFGCAGGEPATLPFACDANLSLGAGESHVHEVTVVIPDDGRLANAPNGLAGRNCVAVLEPGTPVIGAGQLTRAPADPGERLGNAYDCHEFRIKNPEPEKHCSEGFVLNAAGRCVCPEGTTFRDGQCSDGGTKEPEPEQCTLLPGQIQTADGRCVCPQGTVLGANGCYKPETECRLLPGMILTQHGLCVCPHGTELKNGACRKRETPECRLLPGQIRTQDGRCVCPRGAELRNGACRKIETPECRLLPGMIRTQSGRCVCPRGTELRNGACRKIETPECRLLPGMIRTQSGKCVCPKGTELKNGACRKVETPQCRLLPGMIRTKSGQCVCPKGTELRNGACRKVQTPPRECKIRGQVKLDNGRCVCPVGTEVSNGACRKVVKLRPRNPVIKQVQPRNPVIKQVQPRNPVVKKPTIKSPVIKKPTTKTPVTRTPVIKAPVIKKRVPTTKK